AQLAGSKTPKAALFMPKFFLPGAKVYGTGFGPFLPTYSSEDPRKGIEHGQNKSKIFRYP
ncbi:MAG: hypothetical protein LAT55_10580, partial [Opitutales bacterium]|nr:hypothetical protein [Opitutales bacterium]